MNRFRSTAAVRRAVVVALAVAGLGPQAGASVIGSVPRYNVVDLGELPGGTRYIPLSLNNRGEVVGQYTTRNGGGSFYYSDGVMRAQEMGYPAINDAGQTPAHSGDRDINNRGETAGSRRFDWGPEYRATLTTAEGTVDLGTAGADRSEAWALNEHGQVVGQLHFADGATSPFFYSDGVMTALEPTGEPRSVTHLAGAYDINDLGQIVGTLATPQGVEAFLYEDGEFTMLGSLAILGGSGASGINESGQIIGYSSTDSGTTSFLYQDGAMFDLNDLLPPETKWTISSVIDINDLGQILGRGYMAGVGERAVLLAPTSVPEPTALATLSALVLGLAWHRRRRVRRDGLRP